MKIFRDILLIMIIGTAIIINSCTKDEKEDETTELVCKYDLVDSYSIIIYTNTGCIYCEELEANLDENNIIYTAYNLADNEEKMSECFEKLRSIGYMDNSVDLPVVDITTDSMRILIRPDFEADVIPLITK